MSTPMVTRSFLKSRHHYKQAIEVFNLILKERRRYIPLTQRGDA